MGILNFEEEGNLDSVVYFLSEALRGAVEAGDALQHSICVTPHIAPDMDCSQIADQLAMFRRQTNELWSLEVLMLTKILRARDLAKELRFQEPQLKPEIETFRLATVMAEDLLDVLMPVKETIFNGAVQPRRFLEARGHFDLENSGSYDAMPAYRIAGELDVRLLVDACETLHFGVAARYGFETSALGIESNTNDQRFGLNSEAIEEPFLLSDWGEIIGDPVSSMAPKQRAVVGKQSLIH